MDLFEALTQALGLGIAVGAVAAAGGALRESLRYPTAIVAGAAGAVLGALVASGADESAPACIACGVAGGLFAWTVVLPILASAARRAGDGATGLVFFAIVFAAIVAGLSVLLGPLGLAAAVALALVWISRRRRADRKHAGLRVLR